MLNHSSLFTLFSPTSGVRSCLRAGGVIDCFASDQNRVAKRKRFRGFLQEIKELLIYVKEKPVPLQT